MDMLTTVKEEDGRVVQTTTYDNDAVLRANAVQRAEGDGYGKRLVHAARLSLGDVERLRNMGYDLLSNDPQEVRRALCYVQSNESMFLTVSGRPFAMARPKWQ